jgi:hypothetical protein
MATKPNQRNWNDVQTAIATVAIVSTLGLWNLFATPVAKPKTQETQPPPPTEDPPFVNASPTALPHIKIMFATQLPPQAVAIPQQPTAKKHRNNNSGGGSTVTTTKSS